MTMHVKVSGTWQSVNGLYVKVSGTWQPVQTGYTKVSGTWQPFYTGRAATLAGSNGLTVSVEDGIAPYNSGVYYSLDTDGKAYQYVMDEGSTAPATQVGSDWRVGAAASSGYEVECVLTGDALTSGSSPTGSGTWSSLGTTRIWYYERAVVGTRNGSLALTIRDATSQAVLATGTVSLSIVNGS